MKRNKLLAGLLAATLVPAGAAVAITTNAAAPGFTIEISSTALYVSQDSWAERDFELDRSDADAPATFEVKGLPTGASATVTPSPLRAGTTGTLRISTTSATPKGTYELSIRGTAGTLTASKALNLVVTAPRPTIGISGSLSTPMYPGRSAAIDLTLTNTTSSTLQVTSITTAVSVSAPNATAARPCQVPPNLDFKVLQMPKLGRTGSPFPIALRPLQSTTLRRLGVPSAVWPRLLMPNRSVNQDGCKGASVVFRYEGTAQKGFQ